MPRAKRKRRASPSPENRRHSSEPRSKRSRHYSERSRSEDRHRDRESWSPEYDSRHRDRRSSSRGSRGQRKRKRVSSSHSHRDGGRREGSRRSWSHRKDRRRRSESLRSVRSTKKSCEDKKGFRDDENGHLECHGGDVLQDRYRVLQKLGEGTFGQVVECSDIMKNSKIALKIIRSISKYREAAYLEIKVLRKIMKRDPDGFNSLCVRMFDWFDFNGHICISFEVLGLSVFDYMKDNDYSPYCFSEVTEISYQLCAAVAFLHEMRLTHTDLKPENILLANSDYDVVSSSSGVEKRRLKNTRIRLIDFGSATFEHEHHSTVVSTRHYRAPEVILGIRWSEPCDVWSAGCIMFELYTGKPLFQTHSNREHLYMMEKILGELPYRMTKKSLRSYFSNGFVTGIDKDEEMYVHYNCKPLKEHRKYGDKYDDILFDLITKMLEYDPHHRLKVSKAMHHPLYEKLRRKGLYVSR